ncbi:phage tail tube protein [Bartonella queenslandensis]|uniref:phage tail tube protein n=1 Tax=Bartonella queenslandensis TaxID=481138 RepID=UPI00030F4172|nr:phage tail tube protein [Bartonella queenslandensis]
MARAYGWNARLLLGFEKTYGEPPLTGDYNLVPFISSSLDSEQGLIESSVLGLGRDPTAPFQDVINVDGDITVPVDLRNIGYWLKALLGAPVTTETNAYTHSFTSGKVNLPSLSLEIGLPDVPDYPLFTGVRANSCAFNFQRSGEAQVTLGLMGQAEVAAKQTRATNPMEAIYSRFSQFQGSIKSAGSLLANVTAASLTYSNNLEKIETIRDDGKVEAIDAGMSALTGSISVRYGDNTLMDLARSGTPIDIELAYRIDEESKLTMTAHEVYLPKPKRSISGPGGIEASYDFQGAKDAELGKMLTVTLTNDVEDYT